MKKVWHEHKCLISLICGSIVGFINGFFGGGGGIVCVPMLQNFCGYKEKQAHATTICVILPLSIVSSIVYINQNDIDFANLMFITCGAIIGGILGAKLLNKLSTKSVRIIFTVVIFLAGLKTII